MAPHEKLWRIAGTAKRVREALHDRTVEGVYVNTALLREIERDAEEIGNELQVRELAKGCVKRET